MIWTHLKKIYSSLEHVLVNGHTKIKALNTLHASILRGPLIKQSMNQEVINKSVSSEAAWPSGLGRWIWNLEVPSSNPPPYRYLDLFLVAPSSTPRQRCVNSQLVSLQPVGILNSLCSI